MTHILLTPITIRNLTLPNRIFQAPLAGYSNWPFRLMCHRYGGPGLLATEMISAQSLKQAKEKNAFYLERHPEEPHLQYQIWGTDPQAIGDAARICAEAGADTIDLNCGCPARKITAPGAGAAILRDPALIGACVAAMRKAVDIPISIKIRIGPNRECWNCLDVARIAEGEGADFLTIHGRHGKEAYATPVRYEHIAAVVAALSIPVIGNGDVLDGAGAERMVKETGCAGVMVGRGCMGHPWVFAGIKAFLEGHAWHAPSGVIRGKILTENFDYLLTLMGEHRATRHIRKLAAFYSRGLTGSREFRMEVNCINTADDFHAIVQRHFHQCTPLDTPSDINP